MYYKLEVVSSYQHYRNLRGQKATMGVRSDGKAQETPLSTVRLYKMGIPPSGALDISRSLHLIIGYLPNNEHEQLEVIVL